ncbi:MAG: hypothetical protein U0228_33540 [Myxococcaceae bacterium]
MRRVVVVVLGGALCVACSDGATKAWEARQAELEREVATLGALEADPAATQARVTDAGVAWARLSGEVDLVMALRPLDAGVRVMADARTPDVLRLRIEGDVARCAEGLRVLRPLRWLTADWSLRVEGEACQWEATSAPLLSELRARLSTPVVWTPPVEGMLSRVGAAKKRVAALEARRTELLAKLGTAAQVASLEERTAALEKVVAELKARQVRACDEALLSRVALALPAVRLDVSATRLVEPLEPGSDARLRGLVKVVDGGVEWTCVDEAG